MVYFVGGVVEVWVGMGPGGFWGVVGRVGGCCGVGVGGVLVFVGGGSRRERWGISVVCLGRSFGFRV